MLKTLLESVRRWYGAIVVAVAVLATWNSLAVYLQLPGPKLVSESIREVFVSEHLLAAYDIRINPLLPPVTISTALPRSSDCEDTAQLNLVRAQQASLGSPDVSTSVITNVPTLAFVYADSTSTYRIQDLTFAVDQGGTEPTMEISFFLENPPGARTSLLINQLTLETARIADFPSHEFDLEVKWERTTSSLVAAAPSFVTAFQLEAVQGTSPDRLIATRPDTGQENLDLELGPAERVRMEIRFPLADPGIYVVTPSVSGFKSGGDHFEYVLPGQAFGWALVRQDRFASVRPSFDDYCTDFIDVTSTQTPSAAATEAPTPKPTEVPSTAGELILDLTHDVTNDEDRGSVGYWALLDYTKHIQVWRTPEGSFFAHVTYEGQWHTFAGAKSPGAGGTQAADASGTFEGSFNATFIGTLAFQGQAFEGYIGSFDYGGSRTDVLRGTLASGQAGALQPFDFRSWYFTDYGEFNYLSWNWTYHYEDQTFTDLNNVTTGDIVIP